MCDDFSRDFEKVQCDILTSKLRKYNWHEITIKWTKKWKKTLYLKSTIFTQLQRVGSKRTLMLYVENYWMAVWLSSLSLPCCPHYGGERQWGKEQGAKPLYLAPHACACHIAGCPSHCLRSVVGLVPAPGQSVVAALALAKPRQAEEVCTAHPCRH